MLRQVFFENIIGNANGIIITTFKGIPAKNGRHGLWHWKNVRSIWSVLEITSNKINFRLSFP